METDLPLLLERLGRDDQAVALLGFQKGYEAIARLLTTLNSVAETAINMITE